MTDLHLTEVPVTSAPSYPQPEYTSTAPSWLFGFLAAFFQVRNAKARGLIDTGRYWKAAAISTGIGFAISLILSVLVILVFVAAFGSASNTSAFDSSNNTRGSTATVPSPLSTQSGTKTAGPPPASTGILGVGLPDSKPCQGQVDANLNAKSVLTNADVVTIVHQLDEKVITEATQFRREDCYAYAYGVGSRNYKEQLPYAASIGYTYTVFKVEFDPSQHGYDANPSSVYQGHEFRFNSQGSATNDFAKIYAKLIKRDGHWSFAYASLVSIS